jgi:zinc protease
VAFKAPAYTDEVKDSAALDALSFLAFSPNSELYHRLILADQKADSLSGFTPDRVDPALFQIMARIKKPGDIDYVRDAILATVKSFQEKPVDAARLEAVKKRLRYSAAMQMDSSDAIAEILAGYVALRRSPETMNRIYDQYARLTPEDVQQAAAKFLTEERRTIVTLLPGGAR